jgi:microcin C transport system substrate-binding protein
MYPRFWEPYHSDNAYKEEGTAKFDEDGSLKKGLNLKPNTNNSTVTADRELDALIKQYRESEDLDEITRLAHTMMEKLHAHGAYIPGWAKPWYRLGHWRWLRYPKDFNVRLSRDPEEYNVHWIDVDMKKKTLAAKKNNKGFAPQILKFKKYSNQ